jgi:ketosteroid isomerase-like protein
MSPEELMRTIAAAFEKSDLQPLLDALHPDVVWKSAATSEGMFRFGGDYKNKSGATEVLSQISMDYVFHRLRPKEIVTAGDVVWGVFDMEATYEPKGKAVQRRSLAFEMAIRWRLKDGKIIEHQGFFDTATLLVQQGRSPAS